jgi:nucleoside-diphosphate-sugar epimerase
VEVFVTGGSGFVGRELVGALVGAGHEVRALARSPRSADLVAGLGAAPAPGDLGDADRLAELMAGCEAVVHAAAHTAQWDAPAVYERVNVDGTAAVLEAAARAGVPRVVHISTEAVLADGGPLVRVDESRPWPARPVGSYARTKQAAERLVLAADSASLTTVAVRPRLVWGPGDTTILPAIVVAARSGRYAWFDGGRYLTSTCHVRNACAGILAALDRGAGGRAYFLTDGEPVLYREFLTALAATAGVDLPDRSLPRPVARVAAAACETVWRTLRLRSVPPIDRTVVALSGQEMTVDDTRARRELGYTPVLTRAEGLAELAS